MEKDESDLLAGPKMQYRVSKHPGTVAVYIGIVNRVRACPQARQLVCTMSDDGHSYIWDISKQLLALENQGNNYIKNRRQWLGKGQSVVYKQASW